MKKYLIAFLIVALAIVSTAAGASNTKTHVCVWIQRKPGQTYRHRDSSYYKGNLKHYKRVCVASISGQTGPAGPAGPQGPTGPQGTPGVIDGSALYTVSAVGDGTVTATCHEGDFAISGGFADTDKHEWVAASFKTTDGSGWTVKENVSNTNDSPTAVTAYAYCVAGS